MAATTKSLTAKRDRLLLEAEIRDLETREQVRREMPRLVESIFSGIGNATVVDRVEYLHDDDRFGVVSDLISRPSDHYRGDNYPHWQTETQLAEIRGICRFLANVSEAAIGIRDSRRNFVLGQGFEIAIQPKPKYKGDEVAHEVAKELTHWVESQLEKNRWLGELEFEAFNTLLEDGEQVWLIEPCKFDRSKIRLRLEQPDFLTEPTSPMHVSDAMGWASADVEWKYGIAAPDNDAGTALAYHVLRYNETEASVYTPDQVVHVKSNVRSYVKRGVSDFYPVWQTLRRMEKLLGNTTQGAAVQAAIAYIREHAPGTTSSEVKSWLGGRADRTDTAQTANGSRAFQTRKAVPGTIVDMPAGAKYHAGPLGGSQTPIYLEVIQQALRIVGLRWQMPEYMVSGDASNANYASTMVAESPFVKSCESFQYWYTQQNKRLVSALILAGIKAGLVPYPRHLIDRLCAVSVEGQDVAARNEKDAHDLRKSQNESGLLSLESWAAQEGIDLADEQSKGAAKKPASPIAQPTFESWYGYP